MRKRFLRPLSLTNKILGGISCQNVMLIKSVSTFRHAYVDTFLYCTGSLIVSMCDLVIFHEINNFLQCKLCILVYGGLVNKKCPERYLASRIITLTWKIIILAWKIRLAWRRAHLIICPVCIFISISGLNVFGRGLIQYIFRPKLTVSWTALLAWTSGNLPILIQRNPKISSAYVGMSAISHFQMMSVNKSVSRLCKTFGSRFLCVCINHRKSSLS